MASVDLSRRSLLRGSALAALSIAGGGALAACSSGSKQSSGATGPTKGTTGNTQNATIHVAQWGDATRAGLYKDALKLFTQQHPGVSTPLTFADLGPYLQRLATQAAAGALPDVFFMRDTNIAKFAASGVLLNLKPYISNKTIEVADLGATAVADGAMKGGDYALPTHYVGQGIIINTVLFDKYKLSYPKNASWDDLASLAVEFSKAGGTGFWGCNDPTLGTTHRPFQAWARQTGNDLFSGTGSLGFPKEVFADFLSYWQKLRKAGGIPPPATEVQADSTNDQNLLVTKKSAFLWESSNHLTSWQALIKDELNMYSLPTMPSGSKTWWFFPPILISASAKTKNPDMAAALINFLLNSKPAAKITQLNEGAPSSSAIRNYLLPSLSRTDKIFVQELTTQQATSHRPLPMLPDGADAVNTAIGLAAQQVAYGRQSISAAVDDFFTAAQKALTAATASPKAGK